jgi:ribonuclease M5
LLREVIVVEGKKDVAAVQRALDADCIFTGGFTLGPQIIAQIQAADAKRGIIILTDPDSAGEKIRRYLGSRFPNAKHAFVARGAASNQGGRPGIEYAEPEEIRAALAKVKTEDMKPVQIFFMHDMINCGLTGDASSSLRRQRLGDKLGIGWANAKTFLSRLNRYQVTRMEFEAAVAELEEPFDTTDDCAAGSDPSYIATVRDSYK